METKADSTDARTAASNDPYTVVLKRDEDGDVIATIAEFDGCMAHGADEAEALQNLREAQVAWVEAATTGGQAIPAPFDLLWYRPRRTRINAAVHALNGLSGDEALALVNGMRDVEARRVRSLEAIDADLARKPSKWLLERGELDLELLKAMLIPQGWRFEPSPDGMSERILRPDGTLAATVRKVEIGSGSPQTDKR